MSERTRSVARLAAAGLVFLLTLPPGAATGAGGLSPWCLVCGSWGTADLLLNLLLFVPLGSTVARPERGARSVAAALAAGMLLSCVVESVQLLVPGRHTALADLVANTAGAAAGGVLAVTADAWIRPEPVVAGRLGAVWGTIVATTLLAAAHVFSPVPPSGDHRVEWAPALEQYATFPGQVLEAELGGVPLRPGELGRDDRRGVRTLLSGDAELTARVSFGAPSPSLAPIVRIVESGDRDLLVLGQDGPDLVYRLRRRADVLRLHRPEHRARGLLAGTGPADTLLLRLRTGDGSGREGGACLGAGEQQRCGLGFPPGRGWSLLLDLELGEIATRGLDAAWVGALFLPLGFWYRPRRSWGLGVLVAGGGLLAAPAAGPLLAAGWAEAIGVGAGLVAGVAAQKVIRGRLSSGTAAEQAARG